jgi:hypothetical protein
MKASNFGLVSESMLSKSILFSVGAIFGVLSLTGCVSTASESQPSEESQVLSVGDQEQEYLSDIDAVDPDFFVSQKAALLYLKNFCQSHEDGFTQTDPDEIDTVVLTYCGSDLAISLGVIPGPTPPAGVDTEEFATIALERWGIGVPESDGSAIDPVQFGMSLCEADIDLMLSNLGDDFSGSFQEYALETFCPELLP